MKKNIGKKMKKKKKLGKIQKKIKFRFSLQKSLGLHFNSGTRTSIFNVQKTVTRSTGLR